ncbi:hypothetical protein CDD83_10240 [Cordyceps sp. RAO-2017]|nr:hypothetical protein CDD83_10240 [Cordyceps sp. RAO-2017]
MAHDGHGVKDWRQQDRHRPDALVAAELVGPQREQATGCLVGVEAARRVRPQLAHDGLARQAMGRPR